MNPVQGLLALLVGMGLFRLMVAVLESDVMLAGVGAAIWTAALVRGFTGGEYAAYTRSGRGSRSWY